MDAVRVFFTTPCLSLPLTADPVGWTRLPRFDGAGGVWPSLSHSPVDLSFLSPGVLQKHCVGFLPPCYFSTLLLEPLYYSCSWSPPARNTASGFYRRATFRLFFLSLSLLFLLLESPSQKHCVGFLSAYYAQGVHLADWIPGVAILVHLMMGLVGLSPTLLPLLFSVTGFVFEIYHHPHQIFCYFFLLPLHAALSVHGGGCEHKFPFGAMCSCLPGC